MWPYGRLSFRLLCRSFASSTLPLHGGTVPGGPSLCLHPGLPFPLSPRPPLTAWRAAPTCHVCLLRGDMLRPSCPRRLIPVTVPPIQGTFSTPKLQCFLTHLQEKHWAESWLHKFLPTYEQLLYPHSLQEGPFLWSLQGASCLLYVSFCSSPSSFPCCKLALAPQYDQGKYFLLLLRPLVPVSGALQFLLYMESITTAPLAP